MGTARWTVTQTWVQTPADHSAAEPVETVRSVPPSLSSSVYGGPCLISLQGSHRVMRGLYSVSRAEPGHGKLPTNPPREVTALVLNAA